MIPIRTSLVMSEVAAERQRQDEKWGPQNHPDGTGGAARQAIADSDRHWANSQADEKTLAWIDILQEEVSEAFAEVDPAKLRAELVQVAAVAAAWIEALDRRPPDLTSAPETAADRTP